MQVTWIILLALVATARPALAAEQTLFGPAQFTRTAGPPDQFSQEIALPPTIIAPFRLHVENGSPDGAHRVSSATITLNGVQVAGPSDFNQQVAAFDRSVDLQANNTLQVRLASEPGSFLTLTLYGTIPPPTLTSLLPPALPIAEGGTGLLTATISAVQQAPTTLGLISDNPAAATVPPTATIGSGELTTDVPVTGMAPGTATITATLNGSSISSVVTVAPSKPRLTSLSPPTLSAGQGAAGSLIVIINAVQATDTVVYLASSAPAVAGLPPSGAVTVPAGQLEQSFAVFGLSPGSATITAELNGTTAQSQVSVVVPVPTVVSLLPPVLPLTEGGRGTLIVILNAAQPTDSTVALSTSDPAVVGVPPTITVPAQTLTAAVPIQGLALGLATVTASLNGTTATTAIEVLPPPPALAALACPTTLTPAATSLCTLALDAAQPADTTVGLLSSAPGVAGIPPTVTIPAGSPSTTVTVVGLTHGTATLTAGPLNGTQATSDITVASLAPAVTALAPETLSLPKGTAGALSLAIAPTQSEQTILPLGSSDASTLGVPPTVTVPAGASSVAFPVLAEGEGAATVTAGPLNGTSRSATVTVTPPELLALAVTPVSPSIAKGQTEPFTATGTFTDAGRRDLTASAVWSSNNPAVATITSPGGVATGQGVGQATITAIVGRISATATLTVTPPVLASLTISPPNPTVDEGQTLQFSALGILTDGTTQDLTAAATWSSSAPAVATITSQGGLASGLTPGTAVITATHVPSGLSAGTTLTVHLPPPTITGFSPTGGQVGDAITITGRHFFGVQAITFNGAVAPGFTVQGATSLTVAVPPGATTGPLSVTTSAGTATSADPFVVLGSVNFLLTAAPTTAPALPGTGTAFSVHVVAVGDYTNLVNLAVSGLPDGATATLTPAQVAPGASALLTATLPSSLTPGTYAFVVTGTGIVNGAPASCTVRLSLTMLVPGTTALTGRVTTEEASLSNVSIRMGSLTALTDGGGNFLLIDPPTGQQVILIDGSTASTPTVSYPTIPITVSIAPGQVTSLGFTPHLHAQPVGRTVPLIPGQAATITDPAIPGLIVQIPAGVSIIGWDGQPNTQIGMRVVPPDRSPLPPLNLPPGYTAGPIYMFYFGKVGGGTPTAPVPIIGPNDGGGLPGEQVDLYFYDEAPDGSRPNQWAKYGTGTVSSDGTQIIPDVDPATGRPYGMPRFCCGGFWVVFPPSTAAPNLPAFGQGPSAGEPVDLATGLFVLQKTDLVLPGRFPIALTRTYRTLDSSRGPFGPGTSYTYEVFLQALSSDAWLLIMPGNSRALFSRQPDGRYVNVTEPALRGAIATVSGTTRVLIFKDQTVWTFDDIGRLIAQRDRNGNTLTLTRDSLGRLTTLTDPAGRSLTFTYSGTSLWMTQVTDPLGRSVRYTYYDGAGRLATVTDPTGGVTSYTYDGSHRLTTITDPRGMTFLRNEYDAAGRVSRQVQADGGVWNFTYTLTGGVVTETRVTDPRGQTTTARFNVSGHLIGQTDALGQTTTFEREIGTNLLLSTTDPLGRKTAFSYDANGNVTSLTDPAGHVRTFTYEPTFNRLTSLADPLGQTTRFAYDAHGNLTSLTDPLGSTTTITSNPVGQPVTTTDPLGNVTRFDYDAVGNLTTITDPLGNISTRTYDTVSRLLTQTNPQGKTTTFAYDALNRLTNLADHSGGLTRFTYNGNGNLLTVTDALSHTITHTYDSMDRLTTRTDPLGRTESFAYDGNGNLVSTTDRKGQTTQFEYDALNRRVKSTFADGTSSTFTYDAAGRLAQADDSADPHRPITLGYDTLDRLVSETTALGTMAYEYDVLGRRTQMAVNGQSPVSYTYDAASRLRTITQAPLTPVTIDYDALGRRTTLTLPNGVSTEYQYDAASHLTALIYRHVAGLLGDLTYTYDATGNRTGVGGSFARTLLPDPVASATYDAANQQLTFGDKSMAYDANGNVTSITDPSGVTTFTWDVRSRLVGLSGPGTSASFGYDGFGRRAAKQINGSATQYEYDGADITHQVDATGTTTYLRSLNIDEALSFTNRDGTYFSIYDPLGSALAITDSAAAPLVQYTYDPFGTTSSTNPTFPHPFQYTSRENDGTGLHYYRARYYQPSLQRFLSEDPIGFASGDVNLYGYVLNNPLSWTDPLGLKLCTTNLPGMGDTYLDDSIAPLVEDFIRRNTANGIDVRFTEAFRPTEYQNALTQNPNAITPAHPGTSLHEAGFAFDISWRQIQPEDRRTLVENARQAGLRWGGNFKKPDPVHFYKEVLGGKARRSIHIKTAQGDFKKGNIPVCP